MRSKLTASFSDQGSHSLPFYCLQRPLSWWSAKFGSAIQMCVKVKVTL